MLTYYYWIRAFVRILMFMAGLLVSLPLYLLSKTAPDPRAIEDFICREVDFMVSKGCLTYEEGEKIKRDK